jgi:hypothetical protein
VTAPTARALARAVPFPGRRAVTRTHKEVLLGNRAGLPPSSCPGELAQVDRHPDKVPDGSGGWKESTTLVFRCLACGRGIAVRDGAVINDYAIPDPRQVAEELARALRPGP